MKLLSLLLLILAPLPSMADAIRPKGGLYVCDQGNEASICDQDLKVYATDGQLSAIRVEYVGECGSMGPYTYYCDQNICENTGIRFEFKDATHYRWENLQYGFFCDFEFSRKLSRLVH